MRGRIGSRGRAVEGGEEAVACGIDLVAAKTEKLAADEVVVTLQELAPGAVAERGQLLASAHDAVGEQNGGQSAVQARTLPNRLNTRDVVEEGFDLMVDRERCLSGGGMSCFGDLDEPRAGNLTGDKASDVDGTIVSREPCMTRVGTRIAGSTWADVDLFVHARERLDRARTSAPTGVHFHPLLCLVVVGELKPSRPDCFPTPPRAIRKEAPEIALHFAAILLPRSDPQG